MCKDTQRKSDGVRLFEVADLVTVYIIFGGVGIHNKSQLIFETHRRREQIDRVPIYGKGSKSWSTVDYGKWEIGRKTSVKALNKPSSVLDLGCSPWDEQ